MGGGRGFREGIANWTSEVVTACFGVMCNSTEASACAFWSFISSRFLLSLKDEVKFVATFKTGFLFTLALLFYVAAELLS